MPPARCTGSRGPTGLAAAASVPPSASVPRNGTPPRSGSRRRSSATAPRPQHPLRVVVRRLDPLAHHEPPHRRQQRQHVRAEVAALLSAHRRPALRARSRGAPGRPTAVATPVGRSRPRGTGATPRTPARRHAATAAPAAPPPRPDRPTSGSPSSDAPSTPGGEGRQPVMTLQRSLHTKPRTFSPSSAATRPSHDGRGSGRRPRCSSPPPTASTASRPTSNWFHRRS